MAVKKTDEEKNLHKEHRKRMKEKFLKYGYEVLSDHEMVELLLYFSIPYKNTNKTAHRLLEEYGSFSALIDADYEDLSNLNIKDVKDNTACLIRVIFACISKYISEKNDLSGARLTPQNVSVYAKNLFFGHSEELCYALLLDKDCYVKKIRVISTGSMNSTPIYPREVVKFVVSQEEPYVMVLHNHPNGTAKPSVQDIEVTKSLINALSYVDVRLIDHIIVAGDSVVSMAESCDIF